ncbi:MAG: DUF1003 domain-containing protein [Actinomycetaceae bacterium]|nr:DUF1003 domain-containing protein [Actinomycetaceae bacterium]
MGDFNQPLGRRERRLRHFSRDTDAAGIFAERIARFTGTPRFLFYLSAFVGGWLLWNTYGPEHLRFDSAALGFTALTLMLSLQASYSAPLILLAQNRQDDRDRVSAQQDRKTAERNLADTEYISREIAGLRLSMNELATRDFVRSEIRDQLENVAELTEQIASRDQEIAELKARIAKLTGEPPIP